MGWFTKPEVEVRAASSYSDVLVDLLVSRAGGETIRATATGALEAVSGVVARGVRCGTSDRAAAAGRCVRASGTFDGGAGSDPLG